VFGESKAVVVSHDFEAPLAWNAATMRPDALPGWLSEADFE